MHYLVEIVVVYVILVLAPLSLIINPIAQYLTLRPLNAILATNIVHNQVNMGLIANRS